MENKKHKLNIVLHFLLATTLILKGIDKFPHHNVLGGLILLFGLVVLFYFIYTIARKKQSHTMHLIILSFEAIVSMFVAYIFYDEGKKYIQYFFVLAAMGFLISIFILLRKSTAKH